MVSILTLLDHLVMHKVGFGVRTQYPILENSILYL